MVFTKAMIDLAKEIRRRAPSEDKPNIKMANPDFFNILSKNYKQTEDAVMKALIKEICLLAGDPWDQLLSKPQPADKSTVLNYRGLVQHVVRPNETNKTKSSSVPKRIYRGQVVHTS